ncbi:hypothetical protein pipiens_017599 [Culex pipiens pipiens]|uniref:Retrovirus-related Pol polyprotein from transposon TNT 1-94-like beta-barrel domain-containing protein n=1 Tax=Culex pipiens pipiens TaxID=38569 RepID=A0ABD1CG11_CULPP
MTANRSLLDNLDNGSGKVMAANGGLMDMVASGTAEIWPQCSGGKDSVTVSEVQLIPSIAANLLSVSKIVEKGYTMSFTNRGGEVFNSDGDLVETGSNVNNQFKLEKQGKPIPVETLDVLNFGKTRLLPAPAEPVSVEAIPDSPIDLRSDNEDEEEQSETDSSAASEDEFPGSTDDDYESADEHGFAAMAVEFGADDPVTFQEALKRDDPITVVSFQRLLDRNGIVCTKLGCRRLRSRVRRPIRESSSVGTECSYLWRVENRGD